MKYDNSIAIKVLNAENGDCQDKRSYTETEVATFRHIHTTQTWDALHDKKRVTSGIRGPLRRFSRITD